MKKREKKTIQWEKKENNLDEQKKKKRRERRARVTVWTRLGWAGLGC